MQSDFAAAAPRWVPASVLEAAAELASAEIPSRLAVFLARRGVTTPQGAEEFLRPSLDQLHDPFLLRGVRQATKRLVAAQQAGQMVAVVGDYDVDGVSATALLTAVFRACGLQVLPILPERLQEGYGFQPLHVDRAAEQGCQLIVTADCGSTAIEAIDRAREKGLDVIVTDHHLGADGPLQDWAIEINPHAPGSDYPFDDLSGVGVAFKLASALASTMDRAIDPEALLRIACLGTICDLVPLLGENRVIASLGLAALAKTRSPGLRALMRRAGVESPVTAVDVGYRIGPRLNAAGRLASPRPAFDLLMTTDHGRAIDLAAHLDQLNQDRQKAESTVVAEAERVFIDLNPLPPVLVAWSESWHPGVLGIAAGRLARQFHRPTLLMNVVGSEARGSGRSVRKVHLFDFLSQWREAYLRFGGHAQAIGLSVATEDLSRLRDQWIEMASRTWDPLVLAKTYEYELQITAEDVDEQLLGELGRLEPYGMRNRQPLLRVGPLRTVGTIRRFGRGHIASKAAGDAEGVVELLGWGWQEREEDLDGCFEVLANLERDSYHGGPVLRLVDARPWSGSIAEEAGGPQVTAAE
jgi:single-stranded-DNA-specific exonuclease